MTADEAFDTPVLSRRSLLRGAAGLGLTAAAAGLLPACGSGDDKARVQAPPETPTIRLPRVAITAAAAQAVAVDLLKDEGFTDVRLVTPSRPEALFAELATGNFDISLIPVAMAALRIDAGDPYVVLGGINAGCFQIFASDATGSMSDFRGRTITTSGPGQPDDIFLAVMLANVGIDVRKEVKLITYTHDQAVQALISGEVDGMTALPPFSNRLRINNIGHVVLDANVDRPWSQYFFSLPIVHRDYLTKYPVATKRALRALLKSADVVAKDPERGARAMRDQGFIPEALHPAALAELRMIPYDVWRKYEPADTMRFYALRLKEAGLTKGTPDQIISRGTDFRFFQELREELKG